jgi:hypothetical protein
LVDTFEALRIEFLPVMGAYPSSSRLCQAGDKLGVVQAANEIDNSELKDGMYIGVTASTPEERVPEVLFSRPPALPRSARASA